MTDPVSELIEQRTGTRPLAPPVIVEDTTEFVGIERCHVIRIDGHHYLVLGNAVEGRFGIDDEPKYWVKRAIELESGQRKILKLVFHEEFACRIGPLSYRCKRSEHKEGKVLDLVVGHPSFMQGHTARDSRGNLVRIIDYIHGSSVYAELNELDVGHERYFDETFPDLLRRVTDAIEALAVLHAGGLCHGDVRNDHLFRVEGEDHLRWIDFDLTQDFSDFDVWCAGNVIAFIVAKDIISYAEAREISPAAAETLTAEDGSMLRGNRIMNLRKIYPYVPARLNDILLRFSYGATSHYETIAQLVDDLRDAARDLDRGAS